MDDTAPIKKQKVSLKQKYSMYLHIGPKPKTKVSNTNNIFDDLNVKDDLVMEEARSYMRSADVVHRTNARAAEIIKENGMSKDRGRKAIKKPKQVKT